MESDSIFCLHLSYHQDNGTGIRNIHTKGSTTNFDEG